MIRFLMFDSGLKSCCRRLCNAVALALLLQFIGVTELSAQTQPSPQVQQYSAYITFPKGDGISGVCIVSRTTAGVAMSLMNEFGIKVFDATYSATRRKVKLHNVIAPLRKFYIKRVIAQDMKCLCAPELPTPKSRVLAQSDDGTLLLTNRKYKITYRLNPIDNVAE
jgi:hypothetical protein